MNKILSNIINPRKKIAGLDIGNSYIKFMEIEGDSIETAKLANYAIEPVPRDLISADGTITNMQALADVIKICWKKSGSKVKNVAISLSADGVISKKITLSNLDNENELKGQIENEMGDSLPENMSLEDVALDYYDIGDDSQTAEDKHMLIVAAKKEKIDERVALVELAGLIPVIVDVEQYALQNLVRLMQGNDFNEKVSMLVDCSAKVMRLFVYKNGQIIYTKDNEIGGDNFTSDIMNNISIKSIVEAEKLKYDRADDETFNMIEKTFLMNYSSEFLREFQYFVTTQSISEIEEVILCGGGAGILGIEESFRKIIEENNEKHIKTSPYVAHPLQSISKANTISLSKFNRDEPGLFLVTSLAMRQFLRQY